MRKITALIISSLLLAGCAKKDQQGIGVVPLDGAKVTGKVVEASPKSGVLLKTNGGRTALLPDDWTYRKGKKDVSFGSLAPGEVVTAYAPGGTGRLVAAPGKNLVLADGEDTFVLPMEAFPTSAYQVPVRVQTYGGQTSVMPLRQAVYDDGYTVMSHPYYSDYAFPQAEAYSVARAYPVGVYEQEPLALVPSANGPQLMALPPSYYPVQNLQTNQPVRFTYADGNVAVSSWDTLQDGQLSLGKLLLAGTLLKLLPGQAMVQVGSQPVLVPRNYIYQNGYPVSWNAIQPGAPVNVQYYPGVYDVVDYNNNLFTLNYHNTMVQLPVSYLPDTFYRQPVTVCYADGKYKRLPYGQAKKLVAAHGVRLMAYNRPPADWATRFHYRPAKHDSYVVYDRPTGRDHRHHAKGRVVFGSAPPATKWYGGHAHAAEREHKHGRGHAHSVPRPIPHYSHGVHAASSKARGRGGQARVHHQQQSPRRAAVYSAPHHRRQKGPSHVSHGGGKGQARGSQGRGHGGSAHGHGHGHK